MDHNEKVHDLILLEDVTHENIVSTLKSRFNDRHMYTYIRDILVSINPYRDTSEKFSSKLRRDYVGKLPFELPPHVFMVGEMAFRSMMRDWKNQCIIISGESGSGKTESAKRFLEYLGSLSNLLSCEVVKEQILLSNPLLESFGNAKTLLNRNSSRFGKYVKVFYDIEGNPVGGSIVNYLLEKSRVMNPPKEEQSFHIFYQLLNGAPKDLKDRLHLREIADYAILNKSNNKFISNQHCDSTGYSTTLKAMKVINIGEDEIEKIFSVVAAILHLGNLVVSGKDSATIVNQQETLDVISFLLGVETNELVNHLTSRKITVRLQTITTQLSQLDCELNIAAFGMSLYSNLFQWILNRINFTISTPSTENPENRTIGILDIYGFEIFHQNGFEQLCINYCNERLQNLFIRLAVMAEQKLYSEEAIPYSQVAFVDNEPCCIALEKDIFDLLNEQCMIPKGSEQGFSNCIRARAGKNNPYVRFNTLKSFEIRHYAGAVDYEIHGFLERNNDQLYSDISELCKESHNSICRESFSLIGNREAANNSAPSSPTLSRSASIKKRARKKTQAIQFVNQVNSLLNEIEKCSPQYVRCIKPNNVQKALLFDDEIVGKQIRYMGILENVVVRRTGYAFYTRYENFLNHFKFMSPHTWPHYHGAPKNGVKALLQELDIEDVEFGKNQIFIKSPKSVFLLDDLRTHKLSSLIVWLQSAIRGFLAKCLCNRVKKTIQIQTFFRGWSAQHAYRRYKASVVIQSNFKGWRRRKWYLDTLAVNIIAKIFRRYRVQRRFIRSRQRILSLYADRKVRRSNSISKRHFGDYLQIKQYEFMKSYFSTYQDKRIIFCDNVIKTNPRWDQQARGFVITDRSLYNLRPRGFYGYDFRRRVDITRVNRISVSPYDDHFVAIHIEGKAEDDFLLFCERKSELISAIASMRPRLKVNVTATMQVCIRSPTKPSLVNFSLHQSVKGDQLRNNLSSIKGNWISSNANVYIFTDNTENFQKRKLLKISDNGNNESNNNMKTDEGE